MRSFLTLSLFVLFSTTLFSQDDLWQKAVDIMGNNQNWVAGKMVMQFELLDKNDHADLHNISTYKIYLDENGEFQSDLVSMFTNGEDVTDKERENMEKERQKSTDSESKEDSENRFSFTGKDEPFHPENKDKLNLTPRTGTHVINGQTCRIYDFTLPLKENTKSGTIWLDATTGAPVRQKFTTDPLPPKMKEMETVTEYDYAGGALTVSKVEFEGVAGLLIIKKKVRGVMTFEDYWVYDGAVD